MICRCCVSLAPMARCGRFHQLRLPLHDHRHDAIHGDWAGCAQEALQREFPGAIALTALGCGADQNPNPRRTMELVVQYGEALGAGAKRLVKSDLKPVNGPLECRTKHIELAFDKLPGREEWQHSPPRRHRPLRIMQRRISPRLDRGEKIPTHLPYLVQRWSFGNDLAMVFLPGEVTWITPCASSANSTVRALGERLFE